MRSDCTTELLGGELEMNVSLVFTEKAGPALVPAVGFGNLISLHLLQEARCSTLGCESK